MSAHTTSPLMRVMRTPLGRYQLQVGIACLDLGPGEIKKLQHLLTAATEDYAQLIADDARGIETTSYRPTVDDLLKDQESDQNEDKPTDHPDHEADETDEDNTQ